MKEIARLVGVSVSSVSNWVRDVALTEDHRVALHNRMANGAMKRNAARSALARRRRDAFQTEGRTLATRRDPLHLAGCMLFWAEGSRARNSVCFTNSDPAMVAFFVRFLRLTFEVPDEIFRIDVNLFADHVEAQEAIERFWLSTLSLPATCLRKSTVNTYSKYSLKKRQNKLPYGTCRVTVNSTALVQSLYGSIQEYGGFERPEWLD